MTWLPCALRSTYFLAWSTCWLTIAGGSGERLLNKSKGAFRGFEVSLISTRHQVCPVIMTADCVSLSGDLKGYISWLRHQRRSVSSLTPDSNNVVPEITKDR